MTARTFDNVTYNYDSITWPLVFLFWGLNNLYKNTLFHFPLFKKCHFFPLSEDQGQMMLPCRDCWALCCDLWKWAIEIKFDWLIDSITTSENVKTKPGLKLNFKLNPRIVSVALKEDWLLHSTLMWVCGWKEQDPEIWEVYTAALIITSSLPVSFCPLGKISVKFNAIWFYSVKSQHIISRQNISVVIFHNVSYQTDAEFTLH